MNLKIVFSAIIAIMSAAPQAHADISPNTCKLLIDIGSQEYWEARTKAYAYYKAEYVSMRRALEFMTPAELELVHAAENGYGSQSDYQKILQPTFDRALEDRRDCLIYNAYYARNTEERCQLNVEINKDREFRLVTLDRKIEIKLTGDRAKDRSNLDDVYNSWVAQRTGMHLGLKRDVPDERTYLMRDKGIPESCFANKDAQKSVASQKLNLAQEAKSVSDDVFMPAPKLIGQSDSGKTNIK